MNTLLKINDTFGLGLEDYENLIVILSLAASVFFLGMSAYEYIRLLDRK